MFAAKSTILDIVEYYDKRIAGIIDDRRVLMINERRYDSDGR